MWWFIWPVSVSREAYIFLCSIAGGALIAFVYDIFRIKRKAVKTRNIVIQIEDVIFWAISTAIMLVMLYYGNDGEIRGYIFIGTITGVILYVSLLSKIIMRVSLTIINIAIRIFQIALAIASYPFRLLHKAVSIPMGFIINSFRKGLKTIGRAGKNKLSKSAVWRRMFRNIRKNI